MGGGEVLGADQAEQLAPSTKADWGGRSHGGPGHGVALPAAGGGWALDAGRRKAAPRACFPEKLCANAISKELDICRGPLAERVVPWYPSLIATDMDEAVEEGRERRVIGSALLVLQVGREGEQG